MNNQNLLAITLFNGHAACFSRENDQPWWREESIFRKAWYPLAKGGFTTMIEELSARLDRPNQLSDFVVHFVYSQTALPHLLGVAHAMRRLKCSNWQIVQWEPLHDRVAKLMKGCPKNHPRPELHWLKRYCLPVLEGTFR